MLGVSRLLGGVRTETDYLRYGGPQADAWHRPVVVWTTTRRCNLACLHCYAAAGNKPFPGELTTAEARTMLRDLADFGVPVLLLSGGEPLSRPDLIEVAAYARELGLRVTLSTNGTLLGPDVAALLRAIGVGYVGISNHADGALLYGWMRRERGGAEAERVRAELARSGGNRSGIAIAHIDNRGGVHPDQFWWQCKLGNVRRRPFSAIWSDAEQPMLAALRDRRGLLGGRCASCRFLSLCNGNFRVRAAALTGDVWAPDPSCYLDDDEIRSPREAVAHG